MYHPIAPLRAPPLHDTRSQSSNRYQLLPSTFSGRAASVGFQLPSEPWVFRGFGFRDRLLFGSKPQSTRTRFCGWIWPNLSKSLSSLSHRHTSSTRPLPIQRAFAMDKTPTFVRAHWNPSERCQKSAMPPSTSPSPRNRSQAGVRIFLTLSVAPHLHFGRSLCARCRIIKVFAARHVVRVWARRDRIRDESAKRR